MLLWFGTWKNTGPGYQPDWVKLDNRRFPRMTTRVGRDGDSHTPLGDATLAADRRTFAADDLSARQRPPEHLTLWFSSRTRRAAVAIRATSPPPTGCSRKACPPILRALGRPAGSRQSLFGRQADRAFNTWHTARFVDAVAAAGKAIKPLPMLVNAALASPGDDPDPQAVASGGPQQEMLAGWKAGAPSIDVAAPEIHDRKAPTIDAHRRTDHPLMVPEIGNATGYARFTSAALEDGAIGIAPFGIDASGYMNFPLDAASLDDGALDAWTRAFRPFQAGMAREWAGIAAAHPTWGAAKPDDGLVQTVRLDAWTLTARFGEWQFGERAWFLDPPLPPWAAQPAGDIIVAQFSADEFLVTGEHVRLVIDGPARTLMLHVEEGHVAVGRWTTRVWSGAQTDHGLNFVDRPVWLKVTMGAYSAGRLRACMAV